MKVFLSWSGDKSKAAAAALHTWLPTVIQTVRPYMSAESIDKGERWSVDIAKQLEETQFGVICVTPDNKTAPWILFEAGALSKSIDRARVSPLLFGIGNSEFTGSPLLQFQSTNFKKDDFKKLLHSMNGAAPESEQLALEVLNRSFERAWSELEEEISKIKFDAVISVPNVVAPSGKIDSVLDELLDIARSQLKTLKSPEQLLPPGYFRKVMNGYYPITGIPNGLLEDLEAVARLLTGIANDTVGNETVRRQTIRAKDMVGQALRFLRSRPPSRGVNIVTNALKDQGIADESDSSE